MCSKMGKDWIWKETVNLNLIFVKNRLSVSCMDVSECPAEFIEDEIRKFLDWKTIQAYDLQRIQSEIQKVWPLPI